MKADLTALRGRSDRFDGIVGPALRHALVATADEVLGDLLGDPGPGVALVAVGGYGRGEPAFGSDLDLLLVHDGRRRDVSTLANGIWYPLWDAGIALDHSVRTVDEAVSVADTDLKAALGLLDARTVAGDSMLVATLLERVRARWRARAQRRLPELAAAVADRAERFGEVAFLLEPDLKEARGGLRDVHALRALAAAWVADPPGEPVLAPYRMLLDVRGELHRRTSGRGRGEDRLLLQEQTAVADALGHPGADDLERAVALARTVSEAGRTIAWAWDTTWHRAATALRPPSRFRGRRPVRRPLGEDVVEHDGEVQLARDADPSREPVLVLRAAAAAARTRLPIGPHALERLARETPPMPDPWPASARDTLVEVLAAGRPAVAVLETLDQVGMLVRLLPEWTHVRSKPQRNPYHRYTVDRHLVEAATRAAALTRRVDRPDLLLLGSLLHDIGKGYPGDHVPVGAEVAAAIGPRIGLVPEDADVLVTLVREHLLLAEIATRRDLDDPATIERVAEAVGTRSVLELLHALTEADSLATGPTAWNPWKAGLVSDLVRRTAVVLGGGPPPQPPALTPRQRELLARSDGLAVMTWSAQDGADGVWEVVVTAENTADLLAASTGVLALHRLDIRRATARGVDGRALIEAVVVAPHGEAPDGARLRADLLATLAGTFGLAGRLARRERAYAGVRRFPEPAPPQVRFDQAAGSTVVEVHAPDGAGVLHRIAKALAGAGLEVRTAIVATLGLDVVDTFYVRDARGAAELPPTRRAEVEQAVLGVLTAEPAP